MPRRKKKTRASKEYNTEARGNSRYARKKQWLGTHPDRFGVYLFGFQVPHPKPWA